MARIVVVEDDGALRNDIADRLTGWGHEVIQASDGKQGLVVIEKSRPVLVLSDVSMPTENGFELAKRVRSLGLSYADIAFLFISGHADETAVAYGLHCGADDYITKPIDYIFLKERVEFHLRQRAGFMATLVRLVAKGSGTATEPVRRAATTAIARPFGRR